MILKEYFRLAAKVNLDAVCENVEKIHDHLAEDTKILAVVKADAYGHGAVPVAKLIEPFDYIWGFAAATLDEAMLLRRGGISKPILVLGCVFPDQYEEMIINDIRMTCYQMEDMDLIGGIASRLHRTLKIHLKIETGMARLGFHTTEEDMHAMERISRISGIEVEGAFTHFARADETDKAYTQMQMTLFDETVERLRQHGVKIPVLHMANSAATLDMKETHRDMVRAGIILYGMYPSEEVDHTSVKLTPALSLYTHVEYVKTVPKGSGVSYGSQYITEKEMKIATLPVGYADGYPRSLSNKGWVLIHGRKAPILGLVCMDQMMVDVTDIPETQYCDTAVLIGQSGEETITVEDLAQLSGRNNYEFVCALSKRIPRVYELDGKTVEQIDYFGDNGP